MRGVRLAGAVAFAAASGMSAAIASPAAGGPVATSERRPLTIPALREWRPAAGTWHLADAARIVVPAGQPAAAAQARVLAEDLRGALHRRLAVAVGGAPSEAGGIRLQLMGKTAQLGREGYQLQVGRTLTVEAPTATGLFYGGRTLIQLLQQGRSIPRGSARDWPSYPERGLMVDASRTVYSTSWVLREVRRLAALKLNVLHLHLTDDQRWSIASRAYPGIVARGAFTRHDIHRIVRLARRDHVTVVPEVEMPGHLAAFLKHHTRMILKPAGVVPPTTSATYSTDKLDITDPAALHAMRRILDEYLPLFPGKYWDMGTDEYLSPAEYPLFPQLATYAVGKYGVGATPSDAVHGFINWVDRIVRAHGKTLRLWNDQVGLTGRVPVDRDVVVEWWDSFSPFGDGLTVSPQTLLDQGYRVLNAGWYPNYYTADIGPVAGKASLPGVYSGWQVNEFDGTDLSSGLITSRQYVPAGAPGLLGAALSIWGPLDETVQQTATGIEPHLAVLAQKTWDTRLPARTYRGFVRDERRVGLP